MFDISVKELPNGNIHVKVGCQEGDITKEQAAELAIKLTKPEKGPVRIWAFDGDSWYDFETIQALDENRIKGTGGRIDYSYGWWLDNRTAGLPRASVFVCANSKPTWKPKAIEI